MKSFAKWLEQRMLNEAPGGFGVSRGRPGPTFAANRSQLWGPSAQYGRPDTILPWEKIPAAWVTGVGQGIRNGLDLDLQPIPQIEPRPQEHQSLDMGIALPLQLPPEGEQFKKRTNLGELNRIAQLLHEMGVGNGPQAIEQLGASIEYLNNKDGKSITSSHTDAIFGSPDFDDAAQIQEAIHFTEILMHYLLFQKLNDDGMSQNLDVMDPEIHPLPQNEDKIMEAIFRFYPKDKKVWRQSDLEKMRRAKATSYAQKDIQGAMDVFAQQHVQNPEAEQ